MKEYYQVELEKLRNLAKQFSIAHPALAPLLSSEGSDPDVERILEGTAFLTGLINQRLDDNFPEIIQGLLHIIAPQLLMPMPAQTLVQFTPNASVQHIQAVKKGTQLASVPVDGQNCIFTVSHDTNILPCQVGKTTIEQSSHGTYKLNFSLSWQGDANSWWSDKITFYLQDQSARACEWLMLLLTATKEINISCGAKKYSLATKNLSHKLHNSNPFIDKFDNQWQILRDYFNFSENFLFLELNGLNGINISNEHSVQFEFTLDIGKKTIPNLVSNLFALNVVPAINVFEHTIDPFVITHTKHEYRLRISDDNTKNMEIYKVNKVAGIKRGGESRDFAPFTEFDKSSGVYSLRRSLSVISNQLDYFISFIYQNSEEINNHETIIADIVCYQPKLPLFLRLGDVSRATDSSPAMAEFKNITRVTPPVSSITDTTLLWQLFSYMQSNFLPLANAEALQGFLRIYIPPNNPDASLARLNHNRIDAIVDFEAKQEELLYKARPIRGLALNLKINGNAFSSQGEIYLLGSILDVVLAKFSTINSYTRLVMLDTHSGDEFKWPMRLGSKKLI